MTEYSWKNASFLFPVLHNFERKLHEFSGIWGWKDYKMTSNESLPGVLA